MSIIDDIKPHAIIEELESLLSDYKVAIAYKNRTIIDLTAELEQIEECYAALITTEIDATNKCKELESDNKQLVAALEAGGAKVIEVVKLGKIASLETQLADATFDYKEYQRLYREQKKRAEKAEAQLHAIRENDGE